MTWNLAAAIGIAVGLIVLGVRMADKRTPIERYLDKTARAAAEFERACPDHRAPRVLR